jgi:hypothetical protein
MGTTKRLASIVKEIEGWCRTHLRFNCHTRAHTWKRQHIENDIEIKGGGESWLHCPRIGKAWTMAKSPHESTIMSSSYLTSIDCSCDGAIHGRQIARNSPLRPSTHRIENFRFPGLA